jgi:transposase-like protein
MKRSRYTEEQIIGILKQHEAGVTADVCREHGISAATFYGWKSKYGGDLTPLFVQFGVRNHNSHFSALLS